MNPVNFDQFCLTQADWDDENACHEIKILKRMFNYVNSRALDYIPDVTNLIQLSEDLQISHTFIDTDGLSDISDDIEYQLAIQTRETDPLADYRDEYTEECKFWLLKLPTIIGYCYVRIEKQISI
jgi:hypothetical protein